MLAKITPLILAVFLLAMPKAYASSARSTEADSLISTDQTKTYTLPAVSTALIGASSTDTLTNKTISGSSNTLSNLPVATQMQNELPSGTVNGSNVTFTLANTPVTTASVSLFLNGILLIPTTDYSISTATITMTTAPALGQTLRAVYSRN